MGSTEEIIVSVVIPTRNRCNDLEECLESIFTHNYDRYDFEVIVVDNGSADGTKELCNRLMKVYSNLVYHFDSNPGLHVGRNTGIEISRGDILAYLDDDVIVSSGWLQGIIDGFKSSEEIVLIGGNDIPLFLDSVPKWVDKLYEITRTDNVRMLLDFSCIEFEGSNRQICPNFVFGCNFAIRKKTIIEAGGFLPDGMPKQYLQYRGSGETYVSEYIEKKGYKAWFFPEVTVQHKVPSKRMTLKYIKEVAYRNGIGYSYSLIREGKKNEIENFLKRGVIRSLSFNLVRMIKNRAFYNGVRFQYFAYMRDPKLQEWVHRENYLGENKYFLQN